MNNILSQDLHNGIGLKQLLGNIKLVLKYKALVVKTLQEVKEVIC